MGADAGRIQQVTQQQQQRQRQRQQWWGRGTHGAELPQTEQNFLAALVLDGAAAADRYSCAGVGAPAGALGSGTSACSSSRASSKSPASSTAWLQQSLAGCKAGSM
jgi:hypothetical protein